MFATSVLRFAAFALLLAFAAPVLAEKRVALVIGNSAYKHAPALANPRNDAEAMSAALQRLRFDVVFGTDLDETGMRRTLQEFARRLDGAAVGLVFYAGHALQVNGRNYLVPVDAALQRESDLPFQTLALDLVQQLMEQAQRVNIVILDACRDNPLARSLARTMGTRSTGIGNGLGETKAGVGTLIVYATQPGNVALDGGGRHSPFTAALLRYVEAPGLEIRQVLTRVRNDVIVTTGDRQVPWDSSSLRGDFYFASAPGTGVTPPAPQADSEALFWTSIKDSRSAADFRAYLERWPSGTFARLAALRIGEIERADAERQRGEAEARRRAEEERKRKADEAARAAEVPRAARELMRKARAGELADNFCDTTGWPIRDANDETHGFNRWLAASPRAAVLYSRNMFSCRASIVVKSGTCQGRQCIVTSQFICGTYDRCRSSTFGNVPRGDGYWVSCDCR